LLPRADVLAQASVTTKGLTSRIEEVVATSRGTGQVLAGKLMFGRSSSGNAVFWLEGVEGAKYPLRSADGKPVTNVLEARDRARQLIEGGGATRLARRPALTAQPSSTAPGSTTIQAPSQTKLTVDLNDRSMRDGVMSKPWLSGPTGSFFWDPRAITEAKDRGVPVTVVDSNAGRGEKDLHAYITLNNGQRGGGMYCLITCGSNPPFKIPANANAAFIKGYNDMQARMGQQQVINTTTELTSAIVGLPRKPLSPTLTRPSTSTVAVAPPPNRSNTTAPVRNALSNAAANNPKTLPTASATRPKSTGLPTQSSAGPSAGQSPSAPRSLPEPVRNVMNNAAANNSAIPLAVVTEVMNGLGNVPARDAVNRLVKNHRLPLSQARELVGAVRLAQQQASATVRAVIDQASARRDFMGLRRPSFTVSDWNSVEPSTRHTPKTDNPVARQLIKMRSDDRFIVNGTSTIEPRALEKIDGYLRSRGYDPLGSPQSAGAASAIATNPTVVDKVFMQMLGRRGVAASANSKVVIGVIDGFRDPKQPNQPANFSNQEPVKTGVTASLQDRAHGAAVTSVATAGAGNRLEVKTFGLGASNFAQGVQSLVNNGARVINVSLAWNELNGAKTMRDAVRNHPGVHFVVAAGNGLDRNGVGRHTQRLSLGETILAGQPNVTYVGSVDRNGQLSSFSNYQGSTALYAWGEGRTTAGAGASYDQNQQGTSLAAPMVAGVMGKVKALDSALNLAEVKRIVAITADKVRQTTTTDPALKGKTLLVVNSDDAVRLAAVTGMVRRGVSMDSAMQKLGFDAATRAKIEPRARQILGAERREVDKGDAPSPSRQARAIVRVQRPDDLPTVNGYQLTETVMRKLSGNRPGSAVEVTKGKHGLIHLKVERDRTGTASMSMYIDTKMNRLVIEKDGGLWRSANNGTPRERLPSVVRSVLRQAQDLGLTQVEIQRPSADLPQGHEYWARIGFTGIAKDSAMVLKLSSAQGGGVVSKNIGPLIDTPSGRQLWKEAGASSVSLVFDLKAGSDSWRRLDARAIKSQQN
jgi:Subtilase family